MSKVHGLEGLSDEQFQQELDQGAKFVRFPYCVSLLIMTFRRESDIYFIRKGESAFAKSLPFLLVSLFLGWWGLPWGLIYTPMCLYGCCTGGRDITGEMLQAMRPAPEPIPIKPPPVQGPQNPWTMK